MTSLYKQLKEKKILSTDIGDFLFREEPLGSGGNSTVFLFERNNREYAIKFLTVEGINEKIKRFTDEYFALAQCPSHPNILPQYHFDKVEINEKSYFIIISKKFEYSLKKYKKNILDQITNEEEKLKIIEDIFNNLCKGIKHIHNYLIIHRDLKPENIYVNIDGQQIQELVIGDFGIAHFNPEFYDRLSITEAGDRLANYKFSAPEQSEIGKETTYASDIFALGQVMTWLITNQTLHGISVAPIAAEHPWLDFVLKKCLEQDAVNRFQSIEDMETDIKNRKENREKNILKEKLRRLVWDAIYGLDEIIRRSCPEIHKIEIVEDTDIIDEFMNSFNEINTGKNFWYMDIEGGDNYAPNWMKEGDMWIMKREGCYLECKIEKIHIYRINSIHRNFFIIETTDLPPFAYQDKKGQIIPRENITYYKDYAYFFDGKCIDPKEAQNGYYRDSAKISHKLTRDNSYERERILKKFAFMIAPIETPVNKAPRREMSQFIQMVIDNNGLNEELIAGFERWGSRHYGISIIECF